MNLDKLFNPRAVAVVGASDDKTKIGHTLMYNLLRGKKRKVYPINPAFKKVEHILCYPSVKNITSEIDLAVIAVKPEIVPAVLKDCGEKKIPFVIIITAGFKEVGAEGKKLEEEIKTIAAKYKISLVGPNCLGVMGVQSDLNATFAGDLPIKGKTAFISQSGAVGTAMLDWAKKEKIGFSKFVSIGNEAGLTENDFLKYFTDDSSVAAILMYLEGISDGQKFVKLAKKITAKKPLVILKAGKSARGSAAVASHTGSLAPSEKIFQSACRQAGAVYVESLEDMFNLAKMFEAGLLKPMTNLAILTNGGGPSVVMSDLIEASEHLSLAEISEPVKNQLRKVLPPTAAVGNPVDIIGDALSDRYEAALKILTEEKSINGIIVILTPQKMTDVKETAEVLVKYKNKKPIVPVFLGGEAIIPAEEVFKKNRMAYFHDLRPAQKALDALAVGVKKASADAPAKTKKDETVSVRQLDFEESNKLLYSVGLKTVGVFAKQKTDLKKALVGMKYPLAMKVVSEQVIHKSDAGGVQIQLADFAAVEKAWDVIVKNIKIKVPKAKIDGMVIQPMVSGKEVIIGMKRDASFGPVVLFGLGGIFTEVLKDASMRVLSVAEKEAMEMIDELKGSAILAGSRGEKSVDRKALVKIILAIAKLAENHPEIREIDLNPVMATSTGATLVDVRILT
ncbi:MAG: hypothetical protein COU29_03565 [Candidatus Magasanikbacteria bacterium CG10_big_fil_rev_8_21_14_0_10_36_32]|uniref:CoA-binding domain-containing protein n=1 Tax=Candidatus Magasanikbacteria bacterium CG10_big_fil_rev_8_21_14_0_10_36_32 TaxID=1974646 RepID=A0A2M6W5S0_9BACT|nr:MAG: hypothetical protein COU29_03565 [Candidatus Magasanikbacteria bacterium CG10_big_fil_rev_8_21_14_0_10_36_32]